jgi:hypothetical protein
MQTVEESRALLVRGRSLLAAFLCLVALRVKVLARQQLAVETTNVRHGRALRQAVSGWQFHWFHLYPLGLASGG